MLRQPDDATCGPTCLHAVYRFFGDEIRLEALIPQITVVQGGGTIAVNLANHALRRGYRARIYTVNLDLFDPTWFGDQPVDLSRKLRERVAARSDAKLDQVVDGYLEFLRLGGELRMQDLTVDLFQKWLERDRPVLTGLSATFLYRCAREVGENTLVADDIRGVPTGHFVVLCGWDAERRHIRIADPYADVAAHPDRIYWMPVERVINAILLGVLTYDGNLLVIEPKEDLE
jgi:hypothetical protein